MIIRLRCSFLLFALAAAAAPSFGDALPAGSTAAPPITQQQQSMLMEMQDAFTKIAQTVEPTVVNIRSEHAAPTEASGAVPIVPVPSPKSPPKGHEMPSPDTPQGPEREEGIGSGVIVSADGYILTNDHVVDGAQNGKVTVTLADGREFDGKVYPDFRSDLAVVKINPGNAALPVATFGDSAAVQPGQWAIAIGSPFDLQNTMTVGVISALHRRQSISGDNGAERYYPDLLQTDAAINPGNSGGPLYDIQGRVIGINVAIESPVEGSSGVGFAIPSDYALQIMHTLITQGKVERGRLGVTPEDLTPALAQQYGQKQGAFIRDIEIKSPAGKAGLEAADIITSYNGKPVMGELDLRMAISDTPPGTKVQIGYVRDGKPGVTTATVAAAPAVADDIIPTTPAASPAAPKLGLNVRDLTPRDRVTLGLPPDTQGAIVIGAQAGTLADQIGLGSPDAVGKLVIQRINDMPVTDKASFDQAVSSLRSGSPATFIVLADQDGDLQQSALTLQL